MVYSFSQGISLTLAASQRKTTRLGVLDHRKACDESGAEVLSATKPMAQLWHGPEVSLQPGGVPTAIRRLHGRSGFELIVGDREPQDICPLAGIAICPQLKPQGVPQVSNAPKKVWHSWEILAGPTRDEKQI